MAITHVKGKDPVELAPDQHLTTRLWERAQTSTGREILRYWSNDAWRGLTWKQLGDRVRGIAGGLIAAGVQPGDRVALMSGTCLEWTLADLAVLAVGGVTVPIYETSSVTQCGWILQDSGAKLAFAQKAEHAKSLDEAREQAPQLDEIFVFEDAGLDALTERGSEQDRAEVMARSQGIRASDLASIIYTSGTTGNPKGCMLTHANLVWTARQTEQNLRDLFSPDDSTLLFLPLAHVFARLIQFGCLESDVTMGYARSIDALPEDLKSFSPSFLLSVPRVFEKVFNGAQRGTEGFKRKVFDFSVHVAQQWSEARNEGRSPGLKVQLQHGLMDKLVYTKLRDGLGGRMRYCVSGGAPLAPHLAHFFHAAGITILEGYGLTETTAPATANTPQAFRIGTVGQPLPGVEVKVAEDGELLIRGGNVFSGYFNNPAASGEVLEADGWFHSGDIGEITDDGFVRITGRKKEIIVTAGGKNVAPAVLEERVKAHHLVSQCMVVGDNRAFVGCLITLEPEELPAFAKEHGLAGTTAAELSREPALLAELQKAVDHANAAVSKAEAIRKFSVLDRDFTMEDEELTPSLKVRRNIVATHFADDIEELYRK
jgi:long-chain acyl-CoA synthetase